MLRSLLLGPQLRAVPDSLLLAAGAARRLAPAAGAPRMPAAAAAAAAAAADGAPAPGAARAVVRRAEGADSLTITLTVGGRVRNLERPLAEPLERPLQRLAKAAAPPPPAGRKKQRAGQAADGSGGGAAAAAAADAAPFFVGLHAGPTASHPLLDAAATTNADAWRAGRLLRVGGAEFVVEVNPPAVDGLDALTRRAAAGAPLVPVPALAFADEAACEWRWAARAPAARGAPPPPWAPLPPPAGHRRVFTPGAALVGHALRVECTPVAGGHRGAPAALELGPVAAPAPGAPAGASRAAATAAATRPPTLRVVSYNVLADQYAGTEKAKKVLFAHCPPQFLAPDYRRPLVLAELAGYRPDVACLQEVDERFFTHGLAPALADGGGCAAGGGAPCPAMAGRYLGKAGKVREGGATFWRADRFAAAAARDLVLKHFFPAAPGAAPAAGDGRYAAAAAPLLAASPALGAALQRVGTVAQLTLLLPRDAGAGDRPLVVANTHLFYHYAAPHIRTLHTWVIASEAAALADAYEAGELELELELQPGVGAGGGGAAAAAAAAGQQQSPAARRQRPALLLCGDLNSDLNDGVPGAVELLRSGALPAGWWDWAYGAGFAFGRPGRGAGGGEPAAAGAAGDEGAGSEGDEFGEVAKMEATEVAHLRPAPPPPAPPGAPPAVVGLDLALPRGALAPADGLRTPFTNSVRGYQGLLDYVWYDPALMEVARELPPPASAAELGGFLPSPRFPSDHLAVVFDLAFRGAASAAGGAGARPAAAADGGGGAGDAAAGGSPGGGGGGADGGPPVLPAAMHNVGAAAAAVAAGRVVGLPTDTVYGLAADASREAAVAAVYAVKGRDAAKPVAVCVAEPADVGRYGETGHLPPGLVDALLPGPVTLLLPRRRDAPLAPGLNPGEPRVAVRVPDAPFVRAVCRHAGGALALTSANASGAPSSVAVDEFAALWPGLGAVFDGGPLAAGRAGSTVVDLTAPGEFRVARRGTGFAETVRLLEERFGLRHVVGP